MVSMIDSRAVGLGVMVGCLAIGCLGPNPRIDAGEEDSETASGDGDGDPSTGDGDGDPSTGDGDGDGDGDPCQNGVQDGDETDMDCGGSCGPCEPGQGCGAAEDCDSMICDADVCAEPSCTDRILNGDELEADCGGSCRFCAHSPFIDEFDDFPANDVLAPGLSAYSNGDFVLLYAALQTGEHRLRWFDEFAAPMGPGVVLTQDVSSYVLAWQSVVAGDDIATHDAYSVINGMDAMSTTRDLFAIERGPQTAESHVAVYQGDSIVVYGDMVLDGDLATYVWEQDGEIKLRRYNYANAQNVGIAETANPSFETQPGKWPTLAQRDGVTYLVWISCDAMMTTACDLQVRRFDGGWVDAAPISVSLQPQPYAYPQIAVAEDLRVGLTWRLQSGMTKQMWAAILDADLQVIDTEWILQNNYVSTFTAVSDVEALNDGTFVFAWPNGGGSAVNVRRFIAPNMPLVADVDEAPWPSITDPSWVRLATAQNLVVVAWSAQKDGLYTIQGQVLSY